MTILKAVAGSLSAGAPSAGISFSGTFSTISASSPVTSATRTATGTGTIRFNNVGSGDSVGSNPEYSKNGGAWTSVTEDLTLAITTSDTLALRVTNALSGVYQLQIVDHANGALIEDVALEKT